MLFFSNIVSVPQKSLVLCFHIGNTNSRIAYQADEKPDLIAAECGNRLIKSSVTRQVYWMRCFFVNTRETHKNIIYSQYVEGRVYSGRVCIVPYFTQGRDEY